MSGFITHTEYQKHIHGEWRTVHDLWPHIRKYVPAHGYSRAEIDAMFEGYSGTGKALIDATNVGGLIEGSIPFADATGYLAEDNANFFWDETNIRLGVGVGAPVCTGHLRSAICADYAGLHPGTVLLIENDVHAYIQLQGATNANAGILFADDDFNPPAGMVRYDFANDWIEFGVGGNEILQLKAGPTFDYVGTLTLDGIVAIGGTSLRLKNNAEIRFYDNGNYVGFEAPALVANQIWVLPIEDGNLGDVIITSGAGVLSFSPVGAGDVTAAAVLADHTLIRGDGGVKGIQDSGIDIDDANNITFPDGASINLQEDITFLGATTENQIKFPDNLPDALSFKEGANSYMTFISTDDNEKILFSKLVDITKATTLLIDLNPAFTGTGEVIDITPSAPLDVEDAEWDGINIVGNALSPSVIGTHLHGVHLDFSTVDMTEEPHIDALHILVPRTSHIERAHCLHTNHGMYLENDLTTLVVGMAPTFINVAIDDEGATGGDAHILDVARAGGGTLTVAALGTHTGVDVIHQHVGTPAAFDNVWRFNGGWTDVTAECGGVGDIALWVGQDDVVYFGEATTFDEIECIWDTVATKSMHFQFHYSDGATGWVRFYPTDDTNGAQLNGIVHWLASDIPAWATDTVNLIANKYWIRVTRTRLVGVGPTESTIKFIKGISYGWDKLGAINALSLTAPNHYIGDTSKEAPSKTTGAWSKSIGATGDYADWATMIADMPDLIAHQVVVGIVVGTTLAELCELKNKHALTSAGNIQVIAAKYLPVAGSPPTADSATATTLRDVSEFDTNDEYNDCWVLIVDGTGSDDNGYVQITDTLAASGDIVVANWPGTQPDGTSKYIIVGALIDGGAARETGMEIFNSSVPIQLYGIGVKNTTENGFRIYGLTALSRMFACGAFDIPFAGITLNYCSRFEVTQSGIVLCNTANHALHGGIVVNSSAYVSVESSCLSDNLQRAILGRAGSFLYVNANSGDANGAWGTELTERSRADFVGTECSGTSGDHKYADGNFQDLEVIGIETKPGQPSFLANNTVSDPNATGDGFAFTLEFNDEIYDQDGNFATPNFTAPIDGRYTFKCLVLAENVVGNDGLLKLVTSNRTYWSNTINPTSVKTAGGDVGFIYSMDADMDEGDTAYMQIIISGGARTVRIAGHATLMRTCFSGALIC